MNGQAAEGASYNTSAACPILGIGILPGQAQLNMPSSA